MLSCHGLSAILRKTTLILGAAFLVISAPTVRAQDWPAGPITFVVPYAAGGNTDIMARMLAESISQEFGQTVIVDNKGGAGGAIAAEFVARANPDGYTLFFGANAQTSVAPYVQRIKYDPIKNFKPISIFGTNGSILAISSKVPANNVAELIAYAKANPNKINYGSGGIGTIAHLASAMFAARAGVQMQHVPYKGGSQTIMDLSSGHIEMYLGNTSEILPLAGTKELKLLAVSSTERLKDLPNVPAIAETLPGYTIEAWNGLLAPAGTPQAIINKLEAAAMKAARKPDVVAKLEKLGIVAKGTSSAQHQQILESEQVFFRDAVTMAGIKVE
jgi:tripartite-type tricarboxylate transporter receptor subunit TctC